MKLNVIPSENRTESGSWNKFDSDDLDKFSKKYNIKFVDVDSESTDYTYWKNCEDTVVIQLPKLVGWELFIDFNKLNADEFSWDNIDDQSVVIRMWWD